MREGDTLVVWKSDGLSRALEQLKNIINLLNEKWMNFKGLQESVDTGSSGGKLIFHLFDPLAEFEREMISRSDNCCCDSSGKERQGRRSSKKAQ